MERKVFPRSRSQGVSRGRTINIVSRRVCHDSTAVVQVYVAFSSGVKLNLMNYFVLLFLTPLARGLRWILLSILADIK